MLHETRRYKPLLKLKKMRALLEDPKHWCQHDFARDARNFEVGVHSAQATRWCLIGALRHSGGREGDRAYCALLQAIGTRTFVEDVEYFNDSHTHAEVISVLDQATEMEEARLCSK